MELANTDLHCGHPVARLDRLQYAKGQTVKTIILHALAASVPISIFGMATFLIYKQSPGWGWFLFVAFLILGSIKIRAE